MPEPAIVPAIFDYFAPYDSRFMTNDRRTDTLFALLDDLVVESPHDLAEAQTVAIEEWDNPDATTDSLRVARTVDKLVVLAFYRKEHPRHDETWLASERRMLDEYPLLKLAG